MGHLLASNSGPLVSEEKKLHSSQELVNLMTTFPSFTFSCFISISKRFENFPEKLIPTYSIWRSSWRTTLTTQTMTTWCTTTSQHLSFQKLRGSVMTQKNTSLWIKLRNLLLPKYTNHFLWWGSNPGTRIKVSF